ncbi:MAG: hypothetical protein ACRD9W_25105 [Terriglobia bacterium]
MKHVEFDSPEQSDLGERPDLPDDVRLIVLGMATGIGMGVAFWTVAIVATVVVLWS